MTRKTQIRRWYPDNDLLLEDRYDNARCGYAGPAPYLDETAWLRGFPGHRTRPGRSGYDPIDYQMEWAQMQGRFVRALLTGRLRTTDWFHLILMTFAGVVCTLACLLMLAVVLQAGNIAALIVLSPYVVGIGVLGIGLLVNLWQNLQARDKQEAE